MSLATQGRKKNATTLGLTAQERNELRLAFRTYVTDLHMEIAHTDRCGFREEPKARRAVLEEVLRRLSGATTAMTGQGRQGEGPPQNHRGGPEGMCRLGASICSSL
jgi:hypothetical protein